MLLPKHLPPPVVVMTTAVAVAVSPLVVDVGTVVLYYFGAALIVAGIYLPLRGQATPLGKLKIVWSARSKSFEGSQALGYIAGGVALLILAHLTAPPP